jgi:hypothetical protein
MAAMVASDQEILVSGGFNDGMLKLEYSDRFAEKRRFARLGLYHRQLKIPSSQGEWYGWGSAA